MVEFLDLWTPFLSSLGTVIIAILIILILNYLHRNQVREKEQSIYALHDEIDINLNIVETMRYRIDKTLKPYSTDIHLGLSIEDRKLLFENLDMTVFENMKNGGNLRWLDSTRTEIISCYSLIKNYNHDTCFQERHAMLLSQIQTHLVNSQKKLEDTFHFLPRYIKDRKNNTSARIKEDLVTTG